MPDGGGPPVLYRQRWVQLAILASLALLSDLGCFAIAASTELWQTQYGQNAADLIDIFLFTNVFFCLLVTDVTRRLGLRNAILGASLLMTTGFLIRSGVPMTGSLPDYSLQVLGTVLVGAAQPFFQCTPPLLSALWFGSTERSLATAVAINANQVGIGTAFVLGGAMGHDAEGLNHYFGLISLLSVGLSAATYLRFQERPETPPSVSAASREQPAPADSALSFTFPSTALSLFRTPGFMAPLVAFVTSIGVSNVVSAFTSATLIRSGMTNSTHIDLTGAGFQLSIVLAGIVWCGYVDRTKEYKEVTLALLSAMLGILIFNGLAEGYDMQFPPWVVVPALLGLGACAGPIQPINAELAVEVTYPADETSIEAVQQMCGNLFSALLVPLCEYAASKDLEMPRMNQSIPEDMRGDSIVLILLVSLAGLYFTQFNAPLRRAAVDGEANEQPACEAELGMVCEACEEDEYE